MHHQGIVRLEPQALTNRLITTYAVSALTVTTFQQVSCKSFKFIHDEGNETATIADILRAKNTVNITQCGKNTEREAEVVSASFLLKTLGLDLILLPSPLANPSKA